LEDAKHPLIQAQLPGAALRGVIWTALAGNGCALWLFVRNLLKVRQ
jgi:hypothetical protein